MKIDLATRVLSRGRLSRWWNSPATWAREVLGVKLAPYQVEILDALPQRKRVAVRGPHGLGKVSRVAY